MALKEKNTGKHNVTIVGHGMVGHYFCEALLRARAKKSKLAIRIIGDEARLPYDRIRLSQSLASPEAKVEELRPESWYAEQDVEFIQGDRVFEIDSEKKRLLTRNGKYYSYDSLVIASGSKPRVPNIPRIHNPNGFTYRSARDLEQIEKRLPEAKNAIIIGGGLLGLEAAYALSQRGCKSTVFEIARWPMPRQLNEAAGEFLKNSFQKLGIDIHTNKNTVSITAEGDGLIVETSDGNDTWCDLCIVATGDQANSEFVEACGAKVGVQGGIIINSNLETSIPDIYAIGSCAMYQGTRYGLVAPGYAMADVLAQRLNGVDTTYAGNTLSSRLNVGPLEVATFGSYLDEGRTGEYSSDEAYRFISLDKGNLQGAITIGKWEQSAGLESAVQSKTRIAARSLRQFPTTGDIPEILPDTDSDLWPDNAIVCSCTGTTCGKLKLLMSEGNNTAASLGTACRAGTVCESCIPQLKQLTGELNNADAPAQPAIKKSIWMLAMSAFAIAIIAAFWAIPGINPTDTVQSAMYKLSRLWNDSFTKQVTGYSIAGASALSLLVSMRKRVKWFRWGAYQFWRNLHTTLGLTTLIGLFFHTGFSLGDNLNFWLITTFLILNTTGALVAVALSQEHKFQGPRGRQIRFLATTIHMALLWPYIALLGIHIAKVYLY